MYKFCLVRQVNEIELLKSIYCDEGELQVVNEEQYELFRSIIESSKSVPAMDPDELPTFILNMRIPVFDEKRGAREMTMNIKIPPFYPSTEAVDVSFFGISKIFPRERERDLRREVEQFSQSKLGQEYIMDLIQFVKDWIEDNVSIASSPLSDSGSHLSSSCSSIGSSSPQQSPKALDFKRVLIWLSTIAPDRAKIVAEWAKQLALTGLSKFGTPAMVVVEGAEEDVDSFVSSLRTFRWKRLDVLFEDSCKVDNIDSYRKFKQFDDCMVSLTDLQPIFRSAGLEEMYLEGLKVHAPNLKIF